MGQKRLSKCAESLGRKSGKWLFTSESTLGRGPMLLRYANATARKTACFAPRVLGADVRATFNRWAVHGRLCVHSPLAVQRRATAGHAHACDHCDIQSLHLSLGYFSSYGISPINLQGLADGASGQSNPRPRVVLGRPLSGIRTLLCESTLGQGSRNHLRAVTESEMAHIHGRSVSVALEAS
jgi:hypothetical protein